MAAHARAFQESNGGIRMRRMLAKEHDFSRARRQVAKQEPQQGAFAGAVRPHHSEHFAFAHREIDAVDHPSRAIAEVQAFRVDDRRAHLPTSSFTSAGMPIFNCPSALSTSTLTRYTRSTRNALVSTVFGVNSASGEMKLRRPANTLPGKPSTRTSAGCPSLT